MNEWTTFFKHVQSKSHLKENRIVLDNELNSDNPLEQNCFLRYCSNIERSKYEYYRTAKLSSAQHSTQFYMAICCCRVLFKYCWTYVWKWWNFFIRIISNITSFIDQRFYYSKNEEDFNYQTNKHIYRLCDFLCCHKSDSFRAEKENDIDNYTNEYSSFRQQLIFCNKTHN